MLDRRKDESILKVWKGKGVPHVNSVRNRISLIHPHLWRGKPFRELTHAKRKTGGRDETGRIATRHVGGGAKQRIRTIDFYRFIPGIHDVIRLEYDPGRSSHIALLKRRDNDAKPLTPNETTEERKVAWQVMHGEGKGRGKFPSEAKKAVLSGWSYITAPDGLRAGDTVRSFRMGVPQDYVEGWNDLRNSGAIRRAADKAMEAAEAGVDEDLNDEYDIDDDPASPQTVNPPAVSHADAEIGPRALALFRTEAMQPGNVLPLYLIPPGTPIHNIALNPLAKMTLVRSAGTTAELVGHTDLNGDSLGGLDVLKIGGQMRWDGSVTKTNGWALVKMASGEIRRISPGACATVGRVSNHQHNQISLGKAGRARNLGRRPRNRGVSMNAVDHPMGGGKGKGKSGKESTSIYGWTSKGRRTRRASDKGGNKL
ncbi:translation protein SH3-like domain-containing protein [Kockovaella imperatae]|uniref:Translation protein SH3-like domain-containing protein n=1 Tax=Kockovaella imperatae TaxID=4999 RepID=A0A1Y1UIA9_9TREE|nr:translation protein SH3-like domain-containing protein [Kockovaella imperatae]ORX37800.1 translation protein SH3-like domain-containing protein [Kockovaella imperatae]